jgi:predicted Zn-ribbon and HTH transcriptional regulator
METLEKKEFSDKKRKELAGKGHALPDGSFPIENVNDLHNAIQSVGRAKNASEAKAHIIRRAKALNAEKELPEDWKVKKFFEEIKDLIKAIGTSSSINEERDERSVENYVRTGGNTMENTTEPDPKGDIAVTKSLPDATKGPLIGQETRPTDGVSVAPAPNGDSAVVPNQETIPSSATSAIAPTSAEMAEATEESIAKAATCKECGQALPVAKADEIAKAATCPDCGKSMDLCDCMGKAVDEESKEKTPDDEKAEMKKSLWGGAFAPVK